jgi:hypothetical protein
MGFLWSSDRTVRLVDDGASLEARCPRCKRVCEFVECEVVHAVDFLMIDLWDTVSKGLQCTRCEDVFTAEDARRLIASSPHARRQVEDAAHEARMRSMTARSDELFARARQQIADRSARQKKELEFDLELVALKRNHGKLE